MAALLDMKAGNFDYALKLSKNAIARYMYVAKDEHALVPEFVTQGILFRKTGALQDSKDILETAIRNWSEAYHAELLASAHAQLGRTFAALDQSSQALQEYERAAELYADMGANHKLVVIREWIESLKDF